MEPKAKGPLFQNIYQRLLYFLIKGHSPRELWRVFEGGLGAFIHATTIQTAISELTFCRLL